MGQNDWRDYGAELSAKGLAGSLTFGSMELYRWAAISDPDEARLALDDIEAVAETILGWVAVKRRELAGPSSLDEEEPGP